MRLTLNSPSMTRGRFARSALEDEESPDADALYSFAFAVGDHRAIRQERVRLAPGVGIVDAS